MKIVVAGGSGFIGSALVARLVRRGDDVAVLSRDPSRVRNGRGVQWSPGSDGAWQQEVASADVVVNLAGENIGGARWSEERKRTLVASRIEPTRAIVAALARGAGKKPVLINASAVGFYGDAGDTELSESSPQGRGFLADLAKRWEEEARSATCVARVALLRIGVVLAPDGGALEKMLLPFKLFAGGRFGSGKQWMSWIDRDDLLRMFEWAIDEPRVAGTYNATAPFPVRNSEFATTLAKVLARPALLPAPAFALRAALGEMAEPLLLDSQRALPVRAGREGFVFAWPHLEESLRHELNR